ncbi:hypothetical protein ACFLU8_00905, partial [Chloroflexota bacterium]
FTSHIRELGNSVEERKEILEQLGYVPFDMGIWDAWLFLEEASAEKIIREYLIPWFVDGLIRRVRTYSAESKDKVKKRFAEFNYLFCFINQQPVYKNRAWIILDAGTDETRVMEDLKRVYVGNNWEDKNFKQFSEHDFEKYYPDNYSTKIGEVLSIKDKQKKRRGKQELLSTVEDWINQDIEVAKEAFKKSATEVIEILKSIETEMINK